MPDLPFLLIDPSQAARVAAAFDPDAKILRAVETLAPLDGRRVVLLGAAPAFQDAIVARGAIVTATGAGTTAATTPATSSADVAGTTAATTPATSPANVVTHVATGLPDHCAEIVLAPWTGFDGAADAAELAEAERLLAPGGRLIVLQDYGRDDLTAARGPLRAEHLVARSRRDGWLLRSGFRVHVVHAWWRFADFAEAGEVLSAAFGAAAVPVIAALRRPVVAHNVAIYHRTLDES